MVVIFWTSLLLILFTYIGYPMCLALLQKYSPKAVRKDSIFPFVSVVIAVHNEERNIVRRLQNLLQQDYPREKMEMVLVSDGSDDRSVELAEKFGETGVVIIKLHEKSGKAVALNHGVATAKGEIIVFTDARQVFRLDAVKSLVANFADETVGCVSGELSFLEDPDSTIETEMGAYWRYEKFIRMCESESGSVVGATGCIYAIRRALYQPLPAGTLLDDVLTPMNIIRGGKRVLFEAQAIAFDNVSKNAAQEWRRKVRTLAGNWQLLSLAPWIMSPWENPLWCRYVSHKLMRLLVPFELVILFACSVLLSGSFFQLFALMQLAFYGIALSGFLLPATRSVRLVNLSYFFMVLNAAVVAGFWRWATGGCATAWHPAYRSR